MENNRDLLLKKYKSKIIPGEKSIEELIDYLKDRMDIVGITPSELSQAYYQSILFTFVHCIRNYKFNLTANEFDITINKILKNDKSIAYFEYERLSSESNQNDIFVVFEKKAGIIYTNNSKLFLELCIEQGVSQDDYDNETILFDAYLSYIGRYLHGEY